MATGQTFNKFVHIDTNEGDTKQYLNAQDSSDFENYVYEDWEREGTSGAWQEPDFPDFPDV